VTGRSTPPLSELAPRYGQRSLADLMPSILCALGVSGERDVLGLPACRRVAVLLLDGLGLELLRQHPREAPFLASRLPEALSLMAGFPATTVTSLTSLATGLPPGAHGMLGYQVRVPGQQRLLNALRWDAAVDPWSWQPAPTGFERARDAGVAVTHVAPGRLRDTGLTKAALRGAAYRPADTPGELVVRTIEALHAGDRTLVGAYFGDLDTTGHHTGCRSEAWRLQLAHVDRLVEQLAERLPPGATLLVTADHGMVDVAPERRRDVDTEPALADGVALLGGESRARHVYARRGAAADVLATWRELLVEDMWVLSRADAVAAGWFGPSVPESFLPRIGDVVAAAREDAGVVATRREPLESALVGAHGSLTSAEQLVPLVQVTG
jgi:hypothetical protein